MEFLHSFIAWNQGENLQRNQVEDCEDGQVYKQAIIAKELGISKNSIFEIFLKFQSSETISNWPKCSCLLKLQYIWDGMEIDQDNKCSSKEDCKW